MISAVNPHLHTEREAAITRALRTADPDAVVNIDRESGRLSVHTVLDERQVRALLTEAGVEAAPSRDEQCNDDASGGCCGSCG
ncbi:MULTISPECIES: hypothetical protein [unclassified Lysobacter]|uniref:hypothetical protein n=1 Tax=unclassified Lysobacter TaxID=2635362 RepID=UPI001C2477B4|nr:hypothetical protein [Lysobacter sp. MMG2]MBU8975772.1 hypothetical protein [Lysobacter sp. MMG2]